MCCVLRAACPPDPAEADTQRAAPTPPAAALRPIARETRTAPAIFYNTFGRAETRTAPAQLPAATARGVWVATPDAVCRLASGVWAAAQAHVSAAAPGDGSVARAHGLGGGGGRRGRRGAAGGGGGGSLSR